MTESEKERSMEAVEDIVRDMRAYDSGEIADVWIHIFADRIEAAWKAKLAQEMEFAYSSGAMDGKAYSQKVRRNCDKFQDYDTAKEEWFHECCYWFGGCDGCGGTFTKRDEEPDFERWLFMPVKQEESK